MANCTGAVSNDFDSTPVSDGNSQIHVADHPVRGHTRSSPQQNHASQNSRNRARCPMVAARVKWTATSAEAQSKREGKLESTVEHGRGASQCASRNMKGMLRSLSHLVHSGPESKHVRRPSPLGTSCVLCLHSTREASCCHP